MLKFFLLTSVLISPLAAKPMMFQGYVEGKFTHIAPAVAGQIEKMLVDEGDLISEGQELFNLEHKKEEAAYKGALAKLQNAQNVLSDLRQPKRPEEIAAAEAVLQQAIANWERNKLFLARQRKLTQQRVVSVQAFDDAEAACRQSRERVTELEAQLRLAKLPAREYAILAAEDNVRAAEAELKQAEWNLDQKAIESPADARVFEVIFRLGEWVNTGSPVLTLLVDKDVCIRFFVPEPALSQIKISSKLWVRIDGRKKPISAKVSFISPLAQYNPPYIYNRANREKFMYLIEAKPDPEEAKTLHPGQPVDVSLAS